MREKVNFGDLLHRNKEVDNVSEPRGVKAPRQQKGVVEYKLEPETFQKLQLIPDTMKTQHFRPSTVRLDGWKHPLENNANGTSPSAWSPVFTAVSGSQMHPAETGAIYEVSLCSWGKTAHWCFDRRSRCGALLGVQRCCWASERETLRARQVCGAPCGEVPPGQPPAQHAVHCSHPLLSACVGCAAPCCAALQVLSALSPALTVASSKHGVSQLREHAA